VLTQLSIHGPHFIIVAGLPADSRIAVNAKPMQVKKISMVAGGTGITPMYQLARAICKASCECTQVDGLLFARLTPVFPAIGLR
jgi:hypothetical protein